MSSKVAAYVRKKIKSAAELAGLECCYCKTGRCLWLPKCLVKEGLPCRYFERAVLPQAQYYSEYANALPEYRQRIRDWEEREEEILATWDWHPVVQAEQRICLFRLSGTSISGELELLPKGRLCAQCGKAELAPRQRLCPACRKAARRVTKRTSQRKRREALGM